MSDLRKPFWEIILELAKKDSKIIVLVGDLGFSFKERFEEELPKQIINCGIAEQNMIGVACGLALQGFKPYCYSNSIFLTMRSFEFIRDDICYNDKKVVLVGTGASGFLGFSHNMNPFNEDELILKHLPNIKLYFPENEEELRQIIEKSYKSEKPSYIKI